MRVTRLASDMCVLHQRQAFVNASRHLGAFQGLRAFSSSSQLQNRLYQLICILQRDADRLSPHRHIRASHTFLDEIAKQLKKGKRDSRSGLEWTHLPDQVKALAESLRIFTECLDEFSEVGAEGTIDSINTLLVEIQVTTAVHIHTLYRVSADHSRISLHC